MVSGQTGLSRQVSTPCLQPQEADMRSMRSNMSDPAFSHGPSHTPTPGHFSHQNSLHSHQPQVTPGYHPSSLSQHSQPQPVVRPRPPSPVTSSLPPRLSTTRHPYQTMARSVWRSSRISRASTTRWSTWRWRPAEARAGGRVAQANLATLGRMNRTSLRPSRTKLTRVSSRGSSYRMRLGPGHDIPSSSTTKCQEPGHQV